MVSQGKIPHFSPFFQEMDSAQKALEAKAAQLRGLRGAASLGNGELERLVDQMTEELESQAGEAKPYGSNGNIYKKMDNPYGESYNNNFI